MTEFYVRLIVFAALALAGAVAVYSISEQILPVVVAIGVGVAVFGIRMARKTAKQEATLKFMHEYNNSSEVSEGIRMIHQITDDPDSQVAKHFKDRNRPNNKERMNILLVLNKFEILAIGLKRKIYDRKMVGDFLGRDVGEFYDLSKPIIEYIREYEEDEKACEEFENLANEVKKRR